MSSAFFDNKFTQRRETWQNRKRIGSVPISDIGKDKSPWSINALGEWKEDRIVGDPIAIAGYEWCPLCNEVHFMHHTYENNPLMGDLPMALTECDGCHKYFCDQSSTQINAALLRWWAI